MKKILIVLFMLALVGCARPTWDRMNDTQRNEALNTGFFHSGIQDWVMSDSERLNHMASPVKVILVNETSHGVFREKYKSYDVTVKDETNSVYTFYGTTWNVKVGDALR